MSIDETVKKLKSHSNLKAKEGMAKFGIKTENALGISIPIIRKIAKEIGKEHGFALELWKSNIHEAKILATMIDIPSLVTEEQMEKWVLDFNSWDLCDQCCMNLFDKTKYAYKKAKEWSIRQEEFVKRAGFANMAALAVHDKKASDDQFVELFTLIKNESTDDRNFVKKAVNWALRQIGKRNINLNKKAIEVAKEIQQIDSKTAKWIANNAINELESDAVQKRLKKK